MLIVIDYLINFIDYLSNKQKVSMVYRLINHAGWWKNTIQSMNQWLLISISRQLLTIFSLLIFTDCYQQSMSVFDIVID